MGFFGFVFWMFVIWMIDPDLAQTGGQENGRDRVDMRRTPAGTTPGEF